MACQAAIILFGEETELTCICVVAKNKFSESVIIKNNHLQSGRM
jgi:hypothetical protein